MAKAKAIVPFLFELTAEEFANLKMHFASSSWGGRRTLPFAFTDAAILSAIRQLMDEPKQKRRSIGFTADIESKI